MIPTYMIISFVLWAALHSFLASSKVKIYLANRLGANWMDRYYRFFYNLIAIISFLPVLTFLAKEQGKLIYQFPPVLTIISVVVQLAMLVLMVVSVYQTGLLQFMGLKPQGGLNDQKVFVSNGLYRLVRHPIYTTSLILLWVNPKMSIGSLAFATIISLYVLIGIQFEERRLIREFGHLYLDYKTRTPMLIPFTRL